MADIPQVTVIVVNYNSGALLARCISALQEQSLVDFETIVVDNASADDSLSAARISDPRFRVLHLLENRGFAAANNAAANDARSPWIATLNPDAFPEPEWLASFLAATLRYPDVRIMGSTQIAANDDNVLDGAGDCYSPLGFPWRGGYGHRRTKPDPEGEVFGPCAAAAFYHRATFLAVGGFDESFFCYCEDVDLAFRFRLFGYRCIQLGDARVRHVGSAITGVASHFALWHSARNRVWVFIKNMPLPLLVCLFPGHVLATLYLLFRHRNSERYRPMMDGFKAGMAAWQRVLSVRRQVQTRRRASSFAIAKSFTWSLSKLRRHSPDVRSPGVVFPLQGQRT